MRELIFETGTWDTLLGTTGNQNINITHMVPMYLTANNVPPYKGDFMMGFTFTRVLNMSSLKSTSNFNMNEGGTYNMLINF
jgi:hypothetical protein